MPQVISTNIASLNAQRNLNTSQTALQTSLQRLASGMRINTAKDDAAGLSISERMSAQIMGMDTAVRNANDGISLAQTAEGDLAQITTNLQRIRELSVQAANATNSLSDRATIQAEVSQLKSEIDRVAQASSFNGVKLLDGSFTDQSFQVGADNNANNSVTISQVVNARASQLGVMYSQQGVAFSATAALGATDLKINGTAIRASVAGDDLFSTTGNANSAMAKANAINASTGVTGVSADARTVVAGGTVGTTAAHTGSIVINGITSTAVTTTTSAVANGAAVASVINLMSTQTGVTATSNSTTGALTLTAEDGRNVVIGTYTGSLVAADTGLTAATSYGTLSLSSKTQYSVVDGGSGNLLANTGLTAATAAGGASAAVSTIDVTDSNGANAKAALDIVDNALNTINSARASLGAIQNRFSSVVVSLQTSSENLSASRSRIRDTDFAAEVAGLTRNQILQQAGTAMLAQANSLPQTVLSLLK